MRKTLFILILGMFFMGCDPVVYFDFVIKNNTVSDVKITYKKNEKDTILFIPPNKATTIITTLKVTNERNEDLYKKEGMLIPIYPSISVTNKTDSLNIDIWKKENWVFHLRDSFKHKYVLELKEKHFSNKE